MIKPIKKLFRSQETPGSMQFGLLPCYSWARTAHWSVHTVRASTSLRNLHAAWCLKQSKWLSVNVTAHFLSLFLFFFSCGGVQGKNSLRRRSRNSLLKPSSPSEGWTLLLNIKEGIRYPLPLPVHFSLTPVRIFSIDSLVQNMEPPLTYSLTTSSSLVCGPAAKNKNATPKPLTFTFKLKLILNG